MPYHQSLNEITQVQGVVFPIDAATAVQNGSAIDMQGFDAVDVIVLAGQISGTLDAKLQASDDGSTGWADITSAASSQWAATDKGRTKVIALWRPTKRYVRVVMTPTGGIANPCGAVAIKYRPAGIMPVALHSTTLQLVKVAQN